MFGKVDIFAVVIRKTMTQCKVLYTRCLAGIGKSVSANVVLFKAFQWVEGQH